MGFSTLQDDTVNPNMAAANRALIGASGMLPDTFGLTSDDLSDLMNRFRARALGLAGPDPVEDL